MDDYTSRKFYLNQSKINEEVEPQPTTTWPKESAPLLTD